MDPFNLFWKTAAGLENLLDLVVPADWDANSQRGELRIGGVIFFFRASDDPQAVCVINKIDGQVHEVEKSLEKFMIADAMEFILEGLV